MRVGGDDEVDPGQDELPRRKRIQALFERPEGRERLTQLAAESEVSPAMARMIAVYQGAIRAGVVQSVPPAAPQVEPAPPTRSVRWPPALTGLYERASEPWARLLLDGRELAIVPQDGYVILIGPSGSGKSSLTLQMLCEHARDTGPAIYVTHELSVREATARIIGQQCDVSWRDAMCGCVPYERAPMFPRLAMLADEQATPEGLAAAVAELRAEFGEQPILVAWDYLQATPADADERLRVAQLSTRLRRLAKSLRVTMLALSQSSRAGSRQLASGERLGRDTTDAGAESSQLERDAYVTIALGDMQLHRDRCTRIAISVGKYRMGEGDTVTEAIYAGYSGRWRVETDPKPASEVRAEREVERSNGQLNLAALAVLDAVAAAEAPLTRAQLRAALQARGTGQRGAVVTAACKKLLIDGLLVEVQGRKLGGYWPLWTPERAAAAGISLVPPELRSVQLP